MICPKCQFENPEGSQFCINCGASLTGVQVIPETPSAEVTPPPKPSGMSKNTKILIAVLMGAGFLFLLVTVGGAYYFLTSRKKALPTEQPPVTQLTPTPLPTAGFGFEPSPTPAIQTAGRQFNTMEEALTFALTESGMEYAENAKIEKIELLYTPTYKQWTFEFKSRINPHKKDPYAETLYDFPTSTVKIKSAGEFKVASSLIFKDSTDYSYSPLPKPSEVALSSFLDLAKQKVEGAGAKPGGIILAKYRACPGCGYTGDWIIDIVLAGEEEKDKKAAKEVTFRDAVFKQMRDATITISVYQELF